MKKVSVIIPVYNVENYLRKCLNSLVNQTLKDIEIIVVNDGTLDNSQEIIDEYVKKYPKKVVSIIQENGGQGAARNTGLLHAKGEYIGYVDSDDYVEENMYEELYKKAKEEDSDIVICGNNVVKENYEFLSKEDVDKEFLLGKMAVWNKIYKKNIIVDNKIQFRSKVWYEDLDFTMKVYFSSKKISYVDKPLYNYLLREGSTMNNNNIKRNLELIEAFDSLIDYCKDKKIYNKVRALSPSPLANFILDDLEYKIAECMVVDANGEAGKIVSEDKKSFTIMAQDKGIKVTKIKPMGKNIMNVSDFKNGYHDVLVGKVIR